jgi:hypothetical protein
LIEVTPGPGGQLPVNEPPEPCWLNARSGQWFTGNRLTTDIGGHGGTMAWGSLRSDEEALDSGRGLKRRLVPAQNAFVTCVAFRDG